MGYINYPRTVASNLQTRVYWDVVRKIEKLLTSSYFGSTDLGALLTLIDQIGFENLPYELRARLLSQMRKLQQRTQDEIRERGDKFEQPGVEDTVTALNTQCLSIALHETGEQSFLPLHARLNATGCFDLKPIWSGELQECGLANIYQSENGEVVIEAQGPRTEFGTTQQNAALLQKVVSKAFKFFVKDPASSLAEMKVSTLFTPFPFDEKIEKSIAQKHVLPADFEEAKAILKKRQLQISQSGYEPKYTEHEIRYMAARGVPPDRFIVHVCEARESKEHLGYRRDSGRCPIWTTTFDQIEPADTDANLVTNILGFDKKWTENRNFEMYIIDSFQGHTLSESADYSMIPSFENLGNFAKKELAEEAENGFVPHLVNEVLSKEYTPEYEKHCQGLERQFDGGLFSRLRVKSFSGTLPQRESSKFLTRHLILTELGANVNFTGEGFTRPHTPDALGSATGVLEVFTFQKNPKRLDELLEVGKLMRLPLRKLLNNEGDET
jgi:hypothetical protein